MPEKSRKKFLDFIRKTKKFLIRRLRNSQLTEMLLRRRLNSNSNFDIEYQSANSDKMEIQTPYTDTTLLMSRSDNEDISAIEIDPRSKSPKLDSQTKNEIEDQNVDSDNMEIQNQTTEQTSLMHSSD
jgi:hypothetical protein